MHVRLLNLSELLSKKSFFLFGARATGKSTLITQQLPDAFVIDLLHVRTYRALVANPSLLEEMIKDNQKTVVIDEVQKIPEILDEVHRLIQKKKIRFLLTGSSARKLKHGGANLLAGRAREAKLFPLVSREIKSFSLLRIINQGGLPEIHGSTEPDEDLESYVATYLRDEIKAEAVTRNVAAFSEFLDIIARANGQEINYEAFASDLQTSPGTLKNYLQILEDTQIGFRLSGYTATKIRKATVRSKHYLFDLGVTRQLSGRREIRPKTEEFGAAFEHFIILEVRAFLSYRRKKIPMHYWRSTSQFEVDLLLGDQVAIEIKATDNPTARHTKGLQALMEEGIFSSFLLVYTGTIERKSANNIRMLPWEIFLDELWSGQII